MDQVEGFKLFLASVDGARLNRPAPPQQTPEVFEKFLPYALALDVEQAWANKFSRILVAAGTAPAGSGDGYTPSFYSGSSWNTSAARALFRLSEVHSPARSRPLHPRPVRVTVAGVADPVEEGEAAVAEAGEETISAESRPYLEPTRCTLN